MDNLDLVARYTAEPTGDTTIGTVATTLPTLRITQLRGRAKSRHSPLSSGYTVGLTGFEPATP